MRLLCDSDIWCYSVGFSTEDLDSESLVKSRVDELVDNIMNATQADEFNCYLTAGGQQGFRYKVDPTYKGNRSQPKPRHFKLIKDYLIERYNAEEQVDIECDDRLGIEQCRWKDSYDNHIETRSVPPHDQWETMIATIDKDLDMIPGPHYRWAIMRKGEVVTPARFYTVEDPDGIRHFYKQLLIGDKADNIIGVEGLGKVKAAKLLDSLQEEEEMFEAVRKKYQDDERLLRNGRLLWIWRKEDDDWQQHYDRLINA